MRHFVGDWRGKRRREVALWATVPQRRKAVRRFPPAEFALSGGLDLKVAIDMTQHFLNSPPSAALRLLSSCWQWRWLWLGTTAVFGLLGLVYVVALKADVWVASQAIMVRDEANGAVMRLGRFESQTEMKAAQETILEMARNTQVVADALAVVGRPPSWRTWLWGDHPPTTAEVEQLAREAIVVRAPRGAELGTTEVIYIDVKQQAPQRAIELNLALCQALENRMQQVRQSRADGVIAELETAKQTAVAQLQQATQRLQKMETEAGADLSDLRSLTEANSGSNSNRTLLDTIKNELRQAELQLQQLETDLQLATASFDNPDQLLLTPSALVNSQTGLKTLRDGLATATIHTSQMRGRFTDSHPLVQTALQAEAHLRQQLRNELAVAIQSLTNDREIAAERVEKLVVQRTQLESRLGSIAQVRAEYANVASEVRARNIQLQDCERELAQARAAREAAMTSSLMTRLDQPVMGEKPLGPSRSTIVAGAAVCGLLFGLGIVFLLTPLESSPAYGRRQYDYSGVAGRRASDRQALALASTPVPQRRASDVQAADVRPAEVRPADVRPADRTADVAAAANPPAHFPDRRQASGEPPAVAQAPELAPAPVASAAIAAPRGSTFTVQANSPCECP